MTHLIIMGMRILSEISMKTIFRKISFVEKKLITNNLNILIYIPI